MTKRNLIIANIILVFLVITFRAVFGLAGANHSFAVADTQRVSLVESWLKADMPASQPEITRALTRGESLMLEGGLASAPPNDFVLRLPLVEARLFLVGGNALHQFTTGDRTTKVAR